MTISVRITGGNKEYLGSNLSQGKELPRAFHTIGGLPI